MASHGLGGDVSLATISTANTSGKAIVFEASIPAAGAIGYAKGCLWINTSATKNSERIFINTRTNADASWAYVTLQNK